MNRIDRLFGISTMLQSKKYVPAEKIADKFGISVRTVYRDIKALCEQGIPISFEQHKGYFIVEGYFLPPVSFSTEEANALILMEAMVSAFADKSIYKYYGSALNKIKAVLRSGQKEYIEGLANNIKLRAPACLDNGFEYLSVLQNAIATRQMIAIEYKNKKEETSRRELEPIGLVFYALSWHLVGWCHKRDAYRDFKVSRILSLRDTGKPFKKKGHMQLEEYMKMLPVNY
jgi:predicted DNA-binding transcriptional regulator YafY